MEQECKAVNILVIWRGKKFDVAINSGSTLKEFGHELQRLTHVKSDTMRLLVPRSADNSSRLLTPFSDDHSSLSLQECFILEGKSIRMMGVFEDEIEEVSQNGTKADLRIAGFDEEERRLRQRMLGRPKNSLKLPQGAYIFCDFRTLNIPGIELNPPALEALKRMHMLAADPGIVAIMNKRRWRVGVMTEMAPVGRVGISPKCILGFNKNHGEEISLRLRTDDLKGFRKYERIKKTLLHELAHMVYSEHDTNFYALDKQLNQEAASLDWTRSRSHTLSGLRRSDQYEEEDFYVDTTSSSSQKLGGETFAQMETARTSSAAAAYRRLADASINSLKGHEAHVEPDPDESGFEMHVEPDPDDSVLKENMQSEFLREDGKDPYCGPDHNNDLTDQSKFEDHNDSQSGEAMEVEPYSGILRTKMSSEPDPDDCEMAKCIPHSKTNGSFINPNTHDEPDPDDSDDFEMKGSTSGYRNFAEPDPDDLGEIKLLEDTTTDSKIQEEPDPDDSCSRKANGIIQHDDSQAIESGEDISKVNKIQKDEPDPDDSHDRLMDTYNSEHAEYDSNDQELQRIQDPVSLMCTRLQKAIDMLKSEVNPMEATSVLQTLFKIIRNVIEHPDETKFRRLRKANPQFKRNVANYKAAMEILFLVGFNEDTVSDEIGRLETYIVLKRNDPGLLWLAKSSLETCIAY